MVQTNRCIVCHHSPADLQALVLLQGRARKLKPQLIFAQLTLALCVIVHLVQFGPLVRKRPIFTPEWKHFIFFPPRFQQEGRQSKSR